MATTINAGRVRFVSRGTYNNSTQYYLFDLVDYNGSSYIAKENSLGNLPTNTQYWQLIAAKGDTYGKFLKKTAKNHGRQHSSCSCCICIF